MSADDTLDFDIGAAFEDPAIFDEYEVDEMDVAGGYVGDQIATDEYDDEPEFGSDEDLLGEVVGWSLGDDENEDGDHIIDDGFQRTDEEDIAGFLSSAWKGVKKGVRKVGSVGKKILRSKVLKYTAMGVTFVNPALGASMTGALYAANKVLNTAESTKKTVRSLTKRRGARRLIRNTYRSAKSGNRRARGGLRLLALAKKRKTMSKRGFRKMLIALAKRKRVKRIARGRPARAPGLSRRARMRRIRLKKRPVRLKGKPTTGYLVDARGRVKAGRFAKV